jgi:hypothetical protein
MAIHRHPPAVNLHSPPGGPHGPAAAQRERAARRIPSFHLVPPPAAKREPAAITMELFHVCPAKRPARAPLGPRRRPWPDLAVRSWHPARHGRDRLACARRSAAFRDEAAARRALVHDKQFTPAYCGGAPRRRASRHVPHTIRTAEARPPERDSRKTLGSAPGQADAGVGRAMLVRSDATRCARPARRHLATLRRGVAVRSDASYAAARGEECGSIGYLTRW